MNKEFIKNTLLVHGCVGFLEEHQSPLTPEQIENFTSKMKELEQWSDSTSEEVQYTIFNEILLEAMKEIEWYKHN